MKKNDNKLNMRSVYIGLIIAVLGIVLMLLDTFGFSSSIDLGVFVAIIGIILMLVGFYIENREVLKK